MPTNRTSTAEIIYITQPTNPAKRRKLSYSEEVLLGRIRMLEETQQFQELKTLFLQLVTEKKQPVTRAAYERSAYLPQWLRGTGELGDSVKKRELFDNFHRLVKGQNTYLLIQVWDQNSRLQQPVENEIRQHSKQGMSLYERIKKHTKIAGFKNLFQPWVKERLGNDVYIVLSEWKYSLSQIKESSIHHSVIKQFIDYLNYRNTTGCDQLWNHHVGILLREIIKSLAPLELQALLNSVLSNQSYAFSEKYVMWLTTWLKNPDVIRKVLDFRKEILEKAPNLSEQNKTLLKSHINLLEEALVNILISPKEMETILSSSLDEDLSQFIDNNNFSPRLS
ncbi:MAG: hypothetical protein EPO11_10365 [Gammaproteobacteria bacterium]|nr:MAG: hypothetical protein EPO11_10365 [Gammaproteobacteria bacterium]